VVDGCVAFVAEVDDLLSFSDTTTSIDARGCALTFKFSLILHTKICFATKSKKVKFKINDISTLNFIRITNFIRMEQKIKT
jgi:hypothetical protein